MLIKQIEQLDHFEDPIARQIDLLPYDLPASLSAILRLPFQTLTRLTLIVKALAAPTPAIQAALAKKSTIRIG